MRVVERYSHLNGEEHLLVHHPRLWDEIRAAVKAVDAAKCRTKVSWEQTRRGRRLYSPIDLNKAFKAEFERRGWRGERRCSRSAATVVRRRTFRWRPPESRA